jgi:DNA ligase 1
MQHGRDWHGEDVTGWWASEKLHGVRAYWDGDTLWTRSGRAIRLPAALAGQLPTLALDGEIWAGYGEQAHERARAAINRGDWQPGVRFMVFDRPGHDGTWIERLHAAAARLSGDFAQVVHAVRVQNIGHLRQLYLEVKARGGEGLMLMHPEPAHYHRCRVPWLLKLKRDPLPWWRRGFAQPQAGQASLRMPNSTRNSSCVKSSSQRVSRPREVGRGRMVRTS